MWPGKNQPLEMQLWPRALYFIWGSGCQGHKYWIWISERKYVLPTFQIGQLAASYISSKFETSSWKFCLKQYSVHWHRLSSSEKSCIFCQKHWLLLMQSVCLWACFYIPLMFTKLWLLLIYLISSFILIPVWYYFAPFIRLSILLNWAFSKCHQKIRQKVPKSEKCPIKWECLL